MPADKMAATGPFDFRKSCIASRTFPSWRQSFTSSMSSSESARVLARYQMRSRETATAITDASKRGIITGPPLMMMSSIYPSTSASANTSKPRQNGGKKNRDATASPLASRSSFDMEISVPVGCNGIFSPWNRMKTLNSTGFSLGFRGVAGPRLTLEKFGTQDPHQKERDLPAIGPGPAQSAFLAKPHLFITADR